MHRVLDRIGRLALSVWNNLGICNTAVRAPLAQFVGSDTAARFKASRKTPAADELRQLVMEAGFSDVEVSVSRINVHLPQIALSNGALGAMSAIGTKRTCRVALHMSAIGGKADIAFCTANVCF